MRTNEQDWITIKLLDIEILISNISCLLKYYFFVFAFPNNLNMKRKKGRKKERERKGEREKGNICSLWILFKKKEKKSSGLGVACGP